MSLVAAVLKDRSRKTLGLAISVLNRPAAVESFSPLVSDLLQGAVSGPKLLAV